MTVKEVKQISVKDVMNALREVCRELEPTYRGRGTLVPRRQEEGGDGASGPAGINPEAFFIALKQWKWIWSIIPWRFSYMVLESSGYNAGIRFNLYSTDPNVAKTVDRILSSRLAGHDVVVMARRKVS